VDAAAEEYCAIFSAAGGYLAERVTDVRDIRDRAVARLLGLQDPGVPELTERAVIVAHDLAPAETAGLRRDLVLAIVTESGGPTSHTAILAAQMGIPAVVQLPRAVAIGVGTVLAVDGATGEVFVDPDPATLAELVQRGERRTRALGRLLVRPRPATATRSLCWPTSVPPGTPSVPARSTSKASGCSGPSSSSSSARPRRRWRSRSPSTRGYSRPSGHGGWWCGPSMPERTSRWRSPTSVQRRTLPWAGAACGSRPSAQTLLETQLSGARRGWAGHRRGRAGHGADGGHRRGSGRGLPGGSVSMVFPRSA
jgi:phosphohistidine swiveling domain-containing protein